MGTSLTACATSMLAGGPPGSRQGSTGPALFMVDAGRDVWRVRQIIDDPAGDHDWAFTADVDLAASDEAGEPAIRLLDVSSSPS